MKFDDKQMYHIFAELTSENTEFIEQMARAAIMSATEVQQDMFLETPDGTPEPTNEQVREYALMTVTSLMPEFTFALAEAIKKVQFDARFRVQRSLSQELHFIS